MKKETQIEAENYQNKTKSKLPENFKKYIPFLVALVIVVIGVIIFGYAMTQSNNTKNVNNIVKECGPLVAENGKTEGTTPFAPKLIGKLSGNYDSNKAICHWKIDGGFSHDTFPVNGSCVFALRGLATVGEHTISYEADGLKDCPQSVKIKVNKK